MLLFLNSKLFYNKLYIKVARILKWTNHDIKSTRVLFNLTFILFGTYKKFRSLHEVDLGFKKTIFIKHRLMPRLI